MIHEDRVALRRFLSRMEDTQAINIGGFRCSAMELRTLVDDAMNYRKGRENEPSGTLERLEKKAPGAA